MSSAQAEFLEPLVFWSTIQVQALCPLPFLLQAVILGAIADIRELVSLLEVKEPCQLAASWMRWDHYRCEQELHIG